MSWLDTLTPFADTGCHDIWKCQRCHRIIRLYDARNEQEGVAMLQAHQALNCVDDPFLDVAFGGQP